MCLGVSYKSIEVVQFIERWISRSVKVHHSNTNPPSNEITNAKTANRMGNIFFTVFSFKLFYSISIYSRLLIAPLLL